MFIYFYEPILEIVINCYNNKNNNKNNDPRGSGHLFRAIALIF